MFFNEEGNILICTKNICYDKNILCCLSRYLLKYTEYINIDLQKGLTLERQEEGKKEGRKEGGREEEREKERKNCFNCNQRLNLDPLSLI